MARGRGRKRGRSSARRRAALRRRVAGAGALALFALFVLYGTDFVPYLLVALLLAGAVTGGVLLRRAHRVRSAADRDWRKEEARSRALREVGRSDVDGLTGTEFEHLTADLCRRDGCRDVRRVGGARDNGVDVTGRLPDGRSFVVQCKRYAPAYTVSSGAVRELIGARAYASAEVAIFVTTAKFSRDARRTALDSRIVLVPRDLLGHWLGGARLTDLAELGDAGQGDIRHQRRWRQTYGDRRTRG
ncbi:MULTISPECIES: restriction endonuclease [Streptomyces]|uniref:restriction endonuclease n=1 Tax=Streptomyces TaxID=1883 RepID=UPI001477370A|nr:MULTISPECIES: restriction endonuclease [Streptomyces]